VVFVTQQRSFPLVGRAEKTPGVVHQKMHEAIL
jgi:hypothetical protein